MAITDAWVDGRGKPSLGSKSLVLPPIRATVRTGDRLVFTWLSLRGKVGREQPGSCHSDVCSANAVTSLVSIIVLKNCI